jgi:hypothetical protein
MDGPIDRVALLATKMHPTGYINRRRTTAMPQSPHDRAAEFHNKAAHAHQAAATAHGKGDHLSAHELSRQAHEHSTRAFEYSEEASTKFKASKE